jgi:hypothetical protein
MSGFMVAMMPCMIHGGTFACDPETVITVRIDPQTGRPAWPPATAQSRPHGSAAPPWRTPASPSVFEGRDGRQQIVRVDGGWEISGTR